MSIIEHDAIRMYARFCLAHYGAAAEAKVKDKARSLASKGDSDGCRVWGEVAAEIEKRLKRSPASAG